MCIIAIKFKGSGFAPLNIIKNCCDNNPDGFAMAWNQDGQVKTFRTMDKAEALSRYYTLSSTLDPDTTGFVFHARIATHGSKKLENCHCWTGAGLAFAHNGILHNVPNRDDMTDSETFFRDYFLPVYEHSGWKVAERVARAIAGCGSKFAFINKDGDIVPIGEYQKAQLPAVKGKLYFSNYSFNARNGYFSAPRSAVPSTVPHKGGSAKGRGGIKGSGIGSAEHRSIGEGIPLYLHRDERGLTYLPQPPSDELFDII